MHLLEPERSAGVRFGRVAKPLSADKAALRRLDATPARAPMPEDRLCTFGAWLDGTLIGFASLFREPRPGATHLGIYCVAELLVSTEYVAPPLIACCVTAAARADGHTLWANAGAEWAGLWRRCGFSIAGPAQHPRGGMLQFPMVRRVRGAQLHLLERVSR